MRFVEHPPRPIDGQGQHREAVAQHAVAAAKGLVLQRHKLGAVDRQAAGLHLAHDLGPAGAQAQHVAVGDDRRVRHLAGLRQFGVAVEVAGLAMHGDGDRRAHPLIHLDQLVARRMAGDVDEMVAFGDHLDAHHGELVLQAADRDLVAGDDARGKDHHVVLGQFDIGMVVAGDPRQRGARLALAPGADDQDLVAGQRHRLFLGHERRDVGEIAGRPRRFGDPPQRTAGQHHAAAMGGGDLGDGLHPRDVAGETGHDDAGVVLADQAHQTIAYLGFRAAFAFDQRVGRIADHRQHAVLAQLLERGLVGGVADQRVGVELPVAGMQHGAQRGAHHHRVGFGDRVGERDQLQLEGRDLEALGHADDGQRHLAEQPCLFQLLAQQRGGERGGVDRAAQPLPQIGHRADMVLVGVGEHQRHQIVAAALDKIGIGHDDVDARRGIVAEGDAAIDHQPFAGMAVQVQIHADFAGTAERQEQQVVLARHRAMRELRIGVGVGHQRGLRRLISTSPIRVRLGSTTSIVPVTSSNKGARPPVATTFIGLPYSATMRGTMPSIIET